MLRFLSRRVVTTLLTLLFVSIIIFIMGRAAGDPRGLLLPGFFTPEQWDVVGERLGLEKPLYQQYGMFLRDVFTASFGQSYIEQRPVRDVISERIMPTLQLAAASFVLSLVIGVPLGVFSAVRRGGVLDYVAKVVALIGQAAPAFWLGIMFVLIFAVRLGWVSPSGRDEWTGIILPTITMGWYFVAANLRIVRSAMLDVLGLGVYQAGQGQGSVRQGSCLEACLPKRLDPPTNLRWRYPWRPGGRLRDSRDGVRLAGPGAVVGAGRETIRLRCAPGGCHPIHSDIRDSRFARGRALRVR